MTWMKKGRDDTMRYWIRNGRWKKRTKVQNKSRGTSVGVMEDELLYVIQET
jgi:hypothetical protein